MKQHKIVYGFRLLHFPLDESYVQRTGIHPHVCMYIWIVLSCPIFNIWLGRVNAKGSRLLLEVYRPYSPSCPSVNLSVGWLVGWVGRLVCHKLLKGQEVTLPWSYWCTCSFHQDVLHGLKGLPLEKWPSFLIADLPKTLLYHSRICMSFAWKVSHFGEISQKHGAQWAHRSAP